MLKHFTKGITKRWMLSNLSVVVTIVVLVIAGLLFAVSDVYNTTVQQTLNSACNELSTVFQGYKTETSGTFMNSSREYIENFFYKEKMEIMVINASGRIMMTSTGFTPDEDQPMPDFDSASSSEDGVGRWSGNLKSGENVTAVTRIITNQNGICVGAIRYITSLETVNGRILGISLVITAVGLLIIAIVVMMGIYFIRSIVKPVNELSDMAKKIAHGDFSVTANKKYDDEIGELCDAVKDMSTDLQTTDQMKNDFISRVSHELRTPLTAIKGWAETMQLNSEGKIDRATFEKGMNVIIKESSRLTSIVEELLDFSRLQSGRMVLMNEKLDILAELDETVYMLKERAISENKHLLYDEPETTFPPVYGDRNRLKQVFLNIIDNALKYTPAGGVVAIQIIYDKKQEPDKIKVVVTDTGCGIAPEDLPKVKEKFYKANQKVNGSGIGLAVADEIMTLHNGSLDIESGVGVGTTVTLTFPIYNENKNPDIPQTEVVRI
ncbi:MAG: HAMP domain-containing sensor histidine kinase [Ruminococcus sp.]|nr:HAMP domain-containing sensor histidine kinase [Ruminococcus sp.]